MEPKQMKLTTGEKKVGKTRTVILWGREDLLANAVALFLSSKADWEVIRVSSAEKTSFLLHEIARLQPDVVIIYQGSTAEGNTLPNQILKDCTGLKVITVNLDNNAVEVYNKQKVMVREVKDLFKVIES